MLFKQAMDEAASDCRAGGFAKSLGQAEEIVQRNPDYPAIIAQASTWRTGGGVFFLLSLSNRGRVQDRETSLRGGLAVHQVTKCWIGRKSISRSWKEFELEVDGRGGSPLAANVVIICSIGDFDSDWGVHQPGDSITVRGRRRTLIRSRISKALAATCNHDHSQSLASKKRPRSNISIRGEPGKQRARVAHN